MLLSAQAGSLPPACDVSIPKFVHAGETLEFTLEDSDYPVATWSTAEAILSAVDGSASKAADTETADGEYGWTIKFIPATTATVTPGRYHFLLRVSDGTDKVVIHRAAIEVRGDQFTASVDDRHELEKALSYIDRAIAGDTDEAVSSFTIAGRAVSRYSLGELLDARARIGAIVTRMRRRRAGRGRRESLKVTL